MSFNFTKDDQLWQWAVKDFADREIAPKEIVRFDPVFRATIRKMGELGFFGVKLPEQYGGDPASWVMLGILMEELARVNVGLAYYALVTHEAANCLATYGNDELKEEWLPGLISGSTIPCISAAEPDAGVDVGAIESKADKEGDQYVIRGEKSPVSFGMEADLGLFFFRTAPGTNQGITAVALPLFLAGVGRMPVINMGLPSSAPASLTFDGARISTKYRVGEEGKGLEINKGAGTLSAINQIMSGLISLGVAQTAVKGAIQYSKERFAFGKPIGKLEGISGKIAEDLTMLEAGKWLCYRALALKDQQAPHDMEAAMCGWWCPKISCQAIQDSLLIHGHPGFCDEHPFQQMLRDVVGFEIISGTEQMLKLIISHEAIGQVGVPDAVLGRIGNR